MVRATGHRRRSDAGPVTPVRGQLLHLGWERYHVARITWDEGCYLVPWRDGTLLVGATVEMPASMNGRPSLACGNCSKPSASLLPSASTANFLSARAGLRPGSPDALPIVGWSEVVSRADVCDGSFSQRRAARASHGAACRRCHGQRHRRSGSAADGTVAVWEDLDQDQGCRGSGSGSGIAGSV